MPGSASVSGSPRRGTRVAGVSYGEYYPHGATAWWAHDSAAGVSLKRYRYTGMERDEETGLQCHGVRMYAPWLGRWSTADPIGIGDGVNRYVYVHGNPVRGTDRNGLEDVAPADVQVEVKPYRETAILFNEGQEREFKAEFKRSYPNSGEIRFENTDADAHYIGNPFVITVDVAPVEGKADTFRIAQLRISWNLNGTIWALNEGPQVEGSEPKGVQPLFEHVGDTALAGERAHDTTRRRLVTQENVRSVLAGTFQVKGRSIVQDRKTTPSAFAGAQLTIPAFQAIPREYTVPSAAGSTDAAAAAIQRELSSTLGSHLDQAFAYADAVENHLYQYPAADTAGKVVHNPYNLGAGGDLGLAPYPIHPLKTIPKIRTRL